MILIGLFFLGIRGGGLHGTNSGLTMKVSGKVIQTATGKGIPDVDVILFDDEEGEEFEATSGNDGRFTIEDVPAGVYGIVEVDIHMSCPEALIIDKIPKRITVRRNKNLSGLRILLKKGARISGRVTAGDGSLPVANVEIMADPWLRGKDKAVFTDKNGRFKLVGIDSGEKTVFASAPGFADESVELKVISGKTYGNINFVLGKGTVSVKGLILSSKSKQGISGAAVYFLYHTPTKHYSAGSVKSGNNGEYSIVGLKYPGKFKLSIFHDDYKDIDSRTVELKKGENNLDIQLEPGAKKK